METLTYGGLTIVIETEVIRQDQAGNLARKMAHVDAVTVYEQMKELQPGFNPDNMLLPGTFKPARRMLIGAMEVLQKVDLRFATDDAVDIFKMDYLHEFFGTFVNLLYARSLSRYSEW